MTITNPELTELNPEQARYEFAMKEINALIDSKKGSPEYERLKEMTDIAYNYEAKHFPIAPPLCPIDSINN